MSRMVIKVGSHVLTENSGIAKERLLELVKLLTDLTRAGYEVILVSSGAISAGYTKLKLEKDDTINRQALAAIGQPYLLKIYQDLFDNFGILCSQVLLPSDLFESIERTTHAKNAINRLLANNVIPIINENDTVSIEELVVGDNDILSAHAAHYFNAELLVILSDIDAYYDKDPKLHDDATKHKVVTQIGEAELKAAYIVHDEFATGGIVTKLQSANFMMKHGNAMFMASGFDLSDARSFLLDDVHEGGTLFKS